MGGNFAGAFNSPIPADAPTDAQSSTIVSMMVNSMSQQRMGLNESDSVPGIWVATSTDPVYTVQVSGEPAFQFPIPDAAQPGGSADGTASGSDAPLVVFDPANPTWGADTELRLWRAHIDRSNRTVTADGYGIFHYDRSSDGLPVAGWGTGFGLSWAGLIRGWEVQAGAINHALRFTGPSYLSSGWRLPALHTDQSGIGPLQEGMRLQLSPSVDCSTRTVPFPDPTGGDTRLLRIICRALQQYGMICTDGSGDQHGYDVLMELGTENGGTAAWSSVAATPPGGLWGNVIRDFHANATGDGLNRGPNVGIPWDQMRVLASSVF